MVVCKYAADFEDCQGTVDETLPTVFVVATPPVGSGLEYLCPTCATNQRHVGDPEFGEWV